MSEPPKRQRTGWSKHKKKGKDAPKVYTRKERKELRKERRQAKAHYDVVENANKIWEAPLAMMKKAAAEVAISEILESCEGKILQVCAKHDTSRVLQCAMKYGSEEHRQKVFNELKGKFSRLIRDTYTHHLILKLVQYGSEEMKHALVDELSSNIVKLSLHARASKVLDYLFADGTTKIKNKILIEFYSREAVLFQSMQHLINGYEKKGGSNKNNASGDLLRRVLEAQPEKRNEILTNLEHYLEKANTKQTLMFRYNHTLLRSFLEESRGELRTNMMAVVSQNAPPLHHSNDGAWCINFVVGYGGPKLRKNVLKGAKTHVMEWAESPSAVAILCRLCSVVDDTVLIDKQIFKELKGKWDELLLLDTPANFLTFLFSPQNLSKYFTTDIQSMLTLPYTQDLEDESMDDESGRTLTFKKEPKKIQCQLLVQVLPSCIEALLNDSDNLIAMTRQLHPSRLLTELIITAYNWCHDSELGEMVAECKLTTKFEELSELTDQLIDSLISLIHSGEDSLLVDKVGHYVIKRVLLGLKPDCHEFGDKLFDAIEDDLKEYCSQNRSAFVLSTLIEHGSRSTSRKLKAFVRKQKNLKKIAERWAGVRVLTELVE